MDIKYFIKLYTKEHEIIDELYLLSNVLYTKTLNGMGNMQFKIPVRYLGEKGIELALGQHIELYILENNEEQLIWYGVVNSPLPEGVEINCICLGYACLLQNRKFTAFEINEDNEWKKEYNNTTYGRLINNLINEINAIKETGIVVNEIKDKDLKTDRIINWDDDLYDKLQEFIEDSNCYFTIDKDRNFNFYENYGEDKSEYYEITDYNIIDSWDYTIDHTQIYNKVYARNIYTEDEVTTILISEKEDKSSIERYGLREMILSVNDIKLQETLDKQVEECLETHKNPLVNCNVVVGVCENFNIFDIAPGDYIKLNSSKNKLNIRIKVLEYTVDLTTMTVSLSLGNSIFRDNMPTIYRYK